jgi:hypothetical protein
LWEIFTYANSPYPSKANSEVEAYVISGNNPEAPKFCSGDVYVFMCVFS